MREAGKKTIGQYTADLQYCPHKTQGWGGSCDACGVLWMLMQFKVHKQPWTHCFCCLLTVLFKVWVEILESWSQRGSIVSVSRDFVLLLNTAGLYCRFYCSVIQGHYRVPFRLYLVYIYDEHGPNKTVVRSNALLGSLFGCRWKRPRSQFHFSNKMYTYLCVVLCSYLPI